MLEIELEPGDPVEEPVRLSLGNLDRFELQPGHAPHWFSALALKRSDRSVTALSVYTSTMGPAAATLQLWSRAPRPVFVTTRPVFRSDRTSFTLPPRLPSGTYSWAVTVNDEVVAAGKFTTPCPNDRTALNRLRELSSEMWRPPDR
jgi:hypothetical protein